MAVYLETSRVERVKCYLRVMAPVVACMTCSEQPVQARNASRQHSGHHTAVQLVWPSLNSNVRTARYGLPLHVFVPLCNQRVACVRYAVTFTALCGTRVVLVLHINGVSRDHE
jgi:hypothetical protein